MTTNNIKICFACNNSAKWDKTTTPIEKSQILKKASFTQKERLEIFDIYDNKIKKNIVCPCPVCCYSEFIDNK